SSDSCPPRAGDRAIAGRSDDSAGPRSGFTRRRKFPATHFSPTVAVGGRREKPTQSEKIDSEFLIKAMDNLTDSIGALSPEQRELLTLLLQEQGSKFNAFPLSFAQQRLWFLDQLEPGSPAYNIAAAVRMQGSLDLDALKQSFDEIVRRHESLRTTFTSIEGKPVQVIAAELQLTIPLNDLSNLSKDEQESEVLRLAQEESRYQFDFTSGRLINVGVLRLGVEEHVALVTMHHIVSDGWSSGVLIREVAALYETYLQGLPPSLPALPIQYADFSRRENAWNQADILL